MTGLALLALLGAGNTHRDGPHRENVRRGLKFLLQSQDADGCLSGTADRFAGMYCHAIATFALSEAYGMTGERRLGDGVAAPWLHPRRPGPSGGGWRYQPRDAGDTSQLGWQFMALKSADLAGIPSREPTRQGIIRYLQTVASRQYGGLASYRPRRTAHPHHDRRGHGLLAVPRHRPRSSGLRRGGRLPARPLPGQGAVNFYYWYYGTLAMYQFQGDVLAAVEPGGANAVGGPAAQGRRPGRHLGPRRRLGRLRRPDLQHLVVGPLPGGLLPLPAPLFARRE